MRVFINSHIKFMSQRKLATSISIAVMVIALASLAFRGLELGLDFTGGTLIEVGYPQGVELQPIRNALGDKGYGDAVVQHFGSANDVIIRLAPRENVSNAQLSSDLLVALQGQNDAVEMRRVEFVGPQVGEELTEKGGLAMLAALFGILIYVALRFEYRFAVGSVLALAHDVIIVLGIFSVFGLEFDLTVLAAVLAVIGYSLNDTIVVYDRVRENFRKMRKGTSEDIINAALNQTLSRTMVTSVTTLLVLVALFVLGGELIHGFATALLIGVLVGTYSSIFVASAILLAMNVTKEDLAPVKKEDGEEEVYEEIP